METADVSFKVGRRVIYAHKSILKAMTPELYELATHFDKDIRMPIKGVDPEIFTLMLKYVNGRAILPTDWTEHSKQILEASGKYGFGPLKVEAEAWHTKQLKLTVDNAVDELLYADGTLCLGLKKAVMDFIVNNGKSVIASPSFAKLKESTELMTEVMLELAESNESRKRKLDEVSASFIV
jgi:hypothetical protein